MVQLDEDAMWPTREDYLKIKNAVIRSGDEGRQGVEWIQNLKRPSTPEEMADLLAFVILVSGFRYRRVDAKFEAVKTALRAGTPVYKVFGSKNKASAVEMLWRKRKQVFDRVSNILTTDDRALVDWFGRSEIPYIRGPIVRYHAARDLGADVPKPDIWMERLASLSGDETVFAMCDRLSDETGDRRATIDFVLWYAASDASRNLIKEFMPPRLRAKWTLLTRHKRPKGHAP
jgi:hypothetical protein